MSGKISINQWLDDNWDDMDDCFDEDGEGEDRLLTALQYYSNQSVVPALCIHGCEIELDGICQHGNPSPFRKLGII
jgi:flavin reductase (DIM6/NTAB) family NADH-FMN oxidoreductase RutF